MPSLRIHLVLAAVAALVCAASAQEESEPLTGWRIAKISNPTESGVKQLSAIVHYPAKTKDGREAPLLSRKGGHPVVVFLHGFGASGGVMYGIGRYLAQRGYVVVLTNTTRSNRALQATNAVAFFTALGKENERSKSVFAGALDMTRAGVAGHSMGGGNALRVLSAGVGYKAAFLFAPWTTASGARGGRVPDYVDTFAERVSAPVAIVHGVKDRVLPWKQNAKRLFDKLEKDQALFWLLDERADHVNVAVPPIFKAQTDPTFTTCARLATAFFDRYLKGDDQALRPFVDEKKLPPVVKVLYSSPGRAPATSRPQGR